ncbi:RNA 2'-phosphotransferase [Porcincola intestinalis]|uniref:RNA 2'-phosphotransferase n=1 Tax=Porcincola intestinalis TaxID=2606632 RepID=UPI002A8407CB|nr:RNA 2'-phosphotransferase [Porcincola intestinalis]MDY4205499.1 RNA 2'-phosphotransferase [Porcincola intestinalis]
MPDENRYTYISRKMSYALRHNPEKYGLKLAQDGSVEMETFLRAMNEMHHFDPPLTEVMIREVMAHAEKQRFAIEDGRIRALYGHSFQIKVEHKEATPPAVLYHGTARRFLDSIMEKGLLPMGRQYVHMSADIETAEQVGRRRDNRPVILTVDAERAAAEGIKFYIGNDKVWLADQIPPQYLERSVDC